MRQTERADARLVEAIESISEGFVIYDADDRFVMCNETYRNLYSHAADLLVPGTSFEAITRQWLDRGGYTTSHSDPEQVLALVDEAEATLGPIDILVSNAGISKIGPISDLDVDGWSAMIDAICAGCCMASPPRYRCSAGRAAATS